MTRSISSYLPIFRQTMFAAAVFSFLIITGFSTTGTTSMMPPGLCPGGSGVVGGNVFTDFDFNGVNDDGGPGVEGIEVYIYESDDPMNASALITGTTTDADGNYYFDNLTDGIRYRVEFVVPGTNQFLKSSPNGEDSRTSVQYPIAPDCSVDFGVACPADFCGEEDKSSVLAPCYISGDPLAGGNSGTGTGLVAVPYTASGMGQNMEIVQTKDVGTMWGLAYQKESKLIFGSSVLKRHSGFGPGGTGAIYVVEAPDLINGSVISTIDLDALGFDTGTDPRITDPLPSSKELPSHDTEAFSLVGKMSFGDIELSEDGKELWAVNLFDKKLYKIFVDNPYRQPTPADVSSIQIPDPGCSATGEYRPWAVKYYKGKVYVGIVCDASASQDRADLHAYVYVHDTNGAPNNWTSVVDFSLDFERGYTYFLNPNNNKWNPWTDVYQQALSGGFFQYPQPILSDIEIEVDGSLILGFLDRMSQQGGYETFLPNPDVFTYHSTFSAGDVMKVCKIGSDYIVEGDAGCTSLGSMNGQGRNGGEFYFAESFPYPENGAAIHQEVSLGGVAYRQNSGEMVTTAFDPTGNINTGGLLWMSNTTGDKVKGYQVYEAGLGFSGKANGLGDLEIGCSAAPIEIGNYVWYDPNMDGIQDPGEPAIPGVNVSLFSESGTELATVQTDAAGEYYFNNEIIKASNLTPDTTLDFTTNYYIVVGYNQFDIATMRLFDTLVLTIDSTGMGVDTHLNDSDAQLANGSTPAIFKGYPFTPVTTGAAGCNDHTLDFGFFSGANCVLTLDAVVTQDETCDGASNGIITITPDPAIAAMYSIDGGNTYSSQTVYSGLEPGTYTVFASEDGNPACLAQVELAIAAGAAIEPPSDVEGYGICVSQPVPAGEGLVANCVITCSADSTQNLTWWTAAQDGTQVGMGSPFDPVAAGAVNDTVVGTTTFFAQCECGICVSERVPADFTVSPLPNTNIAGPTDVCPGETAIYELQTQLGNVVVWTVSSGGIVLSEDDTQVVVQWSSVQGTGPFSVIATETNAFGCEDSDTADILVSNTTIACNDSVQISLDATGCAFITPDQILEGSYNSYDNFTIEITANGSVIGNKVDCSHVGGSFLVNVIGECDGNSCWSTVVIEDKLPPVIDCPDMNDEIVLDCTMDIDAVIAPMATDNCGTTPDVRLMAEDKDDSDCSEITVKRTWVAFDAQGLESQPCMQFIRLLPPSDPQFPDDVTWTCEQYAAFPNIIEATALHPYILENAAAIDAAPMQCNGSGGDDVPFIEPYHSIYRYWKDAEDLDVSLDPFYDDNIDNPRNDSDPVDCGTPTPETDRRTDLYNTSILVGCPYLVDCNVNPTGHTPTIIQTPVYDSSLPINGLEDADILEMTGSGIPDLSEGYCPFHITHSDQKADACPGADTSAIFKIFRTWTAINWCTGETFTDLQVIKIVDKTAPVISVDPIEVDANVAVNGGHDATCASTGYLPGPVVTDNCGTGYTVQIITPVGEAVYINGVDGIDGGTIPAPGLSFGVHPITYIATDACGNTSQTTAVLTVTDFETPTMICREFTSVSLSHDDWAKVCASDIDEGSTDNCGIDTFLIKKMDEPDSLFRPCVDLTCSDTNFMAIVRAYDYAGNHNQCMVEVTVNDKLRPECYAPEDVWTTCSDIPNYYDLTDTVRLNELFGTATYYDNCNARIVESTPKVDLDQCGVGTITRNWRAFDPSGNRSSNRCRQTIMVQPTNDYKITFPADWSGECGDMEDADDVILENFACDQLAYEAVDLRFDISDDGACYKIIRTYTVLNWCSYDGVSPPIEVPHNEDGTMVLSGDDGAHGYYTYKQLIVVKDTEAPIVSYAGDTEFCSTNADCDGPVNITVDYDEDCTNDITVNWKLDVDCDGITNSEGFNTFNKVVPIGMHCITFRVTDGCGNTGFHTVNFEVKDCKKPTPICHNGLSAELDLDGEIEIWATDFDAGSFDYCNLEPLKFRANNVDDINGDGIVNADDYIQDVPTTANIPLNCDDLGIQFVQMWVGDDFGNWDYCVTFVEVQDNMGFCGAGSKMGGKIATAQGRSVQDVKVELSGDQLQALSSDASGMFEFANVPLGGDYSVTPVKNTDPTNGVTTFDIYKISRHLLNVELLDSPYKIIAADANRSGSVSTLDIVELRKLILYVQADFSNNTSWRFVDKDFIFSNPGNPFASGFPEIVNYNNLAADELNTNFVAVKIGDVNGDAITDNAQSIDNRTTGTPQVVSLNNQSLIENELATVRFNLASAKSLLGYQFTLEFDPTLLRFEDIIENDFVKESNFGFAMLEEGIITASWNRAGEVPTDLFFDLVFRASGETDLKEALKINSRYTRAEAFDTAGDLKNVELRFNGVEELEEEFTLHQNKPNPFSEGTIIGFELPEFSTATLTVFDLSGKVVKVVQRDFQQGYNEIKVAKNELNGAGVYYYRLETATNAATRKMMFLE